ncbi:DUF2125 domain-containing protein [Planktotalea sp.]|uniref:DUF2125 domain-containing protein n=1 Tax=Planktotalea sp. TaxID=2029877 RepID=UPI0032995D7C
MSLRTTIFSTTSLVFLASTATADVTAKDIWSDWKSYMSAFSYSVDASEVMTGDTLTVSGLTMTMPMPEDAGSFAMTVDSIDFVENGDGSVTMVFPNVMPMTFAGQGPEGEIVKGSVEYSMQNMVMRASGDPSKITYDYTADQIGFALKEVIVDGETLPADAIKASFTSKELSGQSIMVPGTLRTSTQSMSLGESSYTVSFRSPEGNETGTISGTLATITSSGDIAIPDAMDPNKMAETLNNGFKLDGIVGYTNSKTEFTATDGGETISGSTGAESASINVRMGKDGIEYSGGSKGTTLDFAGGGIPFPVSAKLGEVAFNLLLPISKTDEPTDFALGLTFGDFETSELLWSIFDAGQVLPRDPATIAFDLTGKVKLLFDLLDEDQLMNAAESNEQPAELNAVTLNNLLVSIAGAKLSGTGDFTFDNTDLISFNGLPKPTGGIDLALQGGNGLMDKLVEMGLLPQEQAMGARMMMGLFARPGEGEDSLTSKIEINEAGHILANGQRIQ